MEAQAPGPATRFSDLPMEVVGIICRPLSVKDRICLSITCRTLLHGLASSEDAWGVLKFIDWRAMKKMLSILPWLAHRGQGLLHLELNCFHVKNKGSQVKALLQCCLEGAPLLHLRLRNLKLSVEEGSSVLQWLGSCTVLTSLALEWCDLRSLPGALELLPALAELSLFGNYALGAASWGLLRQLTALTRLDARFCGLVALPAEFAALPALADLSLANNHWRRNASWGQLRQLTGLSRLDFSYCNLHVLPVELAALPALAALDVSNNAGLDDDSDDTWASLAQCSSLTSLGLGGIKFACLPPALAALSHHLLDLGLNLSDMMPWDDGEASLGPLYSLSRLTRLNLHGHLANLPLPEDLSCLAALQDLDLSMNWELGEEGALYSLRRLTALTRLNLGSCNLKDLPEEITHLMALKDLDFWDSHSTFSEDTSWQHLCKLTALSRLGLGNCNLERLPPELAQLPSLAELVLDKNELLGAQSGERDTAITAKWAALDQLTALTRLCARDCSLGRVPAVCAALPRLRVLCLEGNSMGRSGVEALRPLTRMTALQHLSLTRCCLPRELEVDALPFPLHRLEGWAERIERLSEDEIAILKLV